MFQHGCFHVDGGRIRGYAVREKHKQFILCGGPFQRGVQIIAGGKIIIADSAAAERQGSGDFIQTDERLRLICG